MDDDIYLSPSDFSCIGLHVEVSEVICKIHANIVRRDEIALALSNYPNTGFITLRRGIGGDDLINVHTLKFYEWLVIKHHASI